MGDSTLDYFVLDFDPCEDLLVSAFFKVGDSTIIVSFGSITEERFVASVLLSTFPAFFICANGTLKDNFMWAFTIILPYRKNF
jgi:hypothetical protein